MTKKRSQNPALKAFGTWLTQERGDKRTRAQISIKLTALGVPLGGSTLAQYEKGTVWAPDPGVLWGLSKIYGRPLEQVVELLTLNRANPNLDVSDLIRHVSTGQQAPNLRGAVDVPASAGVQQELSRAQQERDEYKKRLGQAEDVARRLVSITALSEEERSIARARTARRRRNRKTDR